MKRRPRIYYSDAQKELMWDRWQKGVGKQVEVATQNDELATDQANGYAKSQDSHI